MIPRLVAVLGLMVCALSAALLVPTRSEAGACEQPEPRIGLLPIPDTIATDGGLLVRAAAALGGRDDASFHLGPGGRLELRQGHFRVGEREVDARLEPLGAGFARVVPVTPIDGPAQFMSANGPIPVHFEERAPTLTSAPALTQASLRVRRRRANGEDYDVRYLLRVSLRRNAPAEARALLLYEGDAEQAVAYTELRPPSGRRIEVASGGSCDTFGWPFSWPTPHSRVRAAYVDDSGRLSPLSAPQRLR